MTPGCLVRIVDVDNWRGMWVGLPNGEEEWIPAPFLTAVYVDGTAAPSRSEILYGGRLLIVQSDVLKEVQS